MKFAGSKRSRVAAARPLPPYPCNKFSHLIKHSRQLRTEASETLGYARDAHHLISRLTSALCLFSSSISRETVRTPPRCRRCSRDNAGRHLGPLYRRSRCNFGLTMAGTMLLGVHGVHLRQCMASNSCNQWLPYMVRGGNIILPLLPVVSQTPPARCRPSAAPVHEATKGPVRESAPGST